MKITRISKQEIALFITRVSGLVFVGMMLVVGYLWLPDFIGWYGGKAALHNLSGLFNLTPMAITVLIPAVGVYIVAGILIPPNAEGGNVQSS